MRQWTASIFAAIASLAGIATAEAAPIPITSVTPAQLLADFNVITDQNLTISNDIMGPVLVGGNLRATGGPLNSSGVVLGTSAGTTAITGYGEVDVFGNVVGGTNVSLMNSVTFIGGNNNGSLLNPGTGSVLHGYVFPPGSTVADNPTTFQNNIWNPLTSVSSRLATLTANSSLSGNTFTGVAGPNGAVFSVSLATLNGLTGPLSFAGCLAATNPGGPCDAVIDVTGAGTLNQKFAFPLVAAGFPNIIVNFDNDVTVDVNNVWTASILDPLGSVSAMTDITGNVVAQNFTTTAETHLPGFDCSDGLCLCPPGFPGCSVAPPRIPEPASLAVLGSAFAAFAVARRRRAWRPDPG